MSANPQDGAAILRKRLLEASAASATPCLLCRFEYKRFYSVVEVGVCYKTNSDDVAFGFGVVQFNVVPY